MTGNQFILRRDRRFLWGLAAVLSILLALPLPVQGASCCGTATAAPHLITSDHSAQLSSMAAVNQSFGYLAPNGELFVYDRDTQVTTGVTSLNATYRITDSWQLGAQLSGHVYPSWQIGDTVVLVGYELFLEGPEHPQVLLFERTTLPTGTSTYEKSGDATGETSVTGRGFYSFALGALALRSWGLWDAQAQIAFQGALAREFSQLHVRPGMGVEVSLSGGWTLPRSRWRLGAGLSWEGETPIRIQFHDSSIGSSTSQPIQRSRVRGEIGYLWSDDWSANLSVNTQPSFLPSSNTVLESGVKLLVHHRWSP